MRVFTILTGILAAAVASLASSINTRVPAAGNVATSAENYTIYDKGKDEVRIITDKVNGEFVRPDTYQVYDGYVCKFFSESTRGVGYLIGEFHGPSYGVFGKQHYAAFYECWDSAPVNARNMPAPIGRAYDIDETVPNRAISLGVGRLISSVRRAEVDSGYSCSFYWDHENRKVLLTVVTGPSAYTFFKTAPPNSYSCKKTETILSQANGGDDDDGEEEEDGGGQIIPCGFVRTGAGATYSLNMTGKGISRPTYFAINGEPYTPTFFHVNEGCDCNIYSSDSGRSGPALILTAHGREEGELKEADEPARYECWINKREGS